MTDLSTTILDTFRQPNSRELWDRAIADAEEMIGDENGARKATETVTKDVKGVARYWRSVSEYRYRANSESESGSVTPS